MDGAIGLAPAPTAPAGSGDPSRRWALVLPDGRARFPGVTRPEGESAISALLTAPADDWDALLVEVSLAVLLTEGAGPYVLDHDGRITLVLGAHPTLAGEHLAMGEPLPHHRVGLVRRCGQGRLWQWTARAEVPPAGRVRALDALDAVTDLAGGREWAARHGAAEGSAR